MKYLCQKSWCKQRPFVKKAGNLLINTKEETHEKMEKDDDQLVLQGYELGLGWTLALDRDTGNMRITFARWDASFVIFDACTSHLMN